MSKNLLSYKGYNGTCEVSIVDSCVHGKILFISDTVTFAADSVAELKVEFEASVDDYLETCIEVGKELCKPMTGSFNVRIGSDLHKEAIIKSEQDGISLNQVAKNAFNYYLNSSKEVHHHVSVNIEQTVGPKKPTIERFEVNPFPWNVECPEKLHA